MITSTPEGRFVYWPEHVPADLTLDDQEHFIACLDNLPFQEGVKLVDYDTDTELIESTGTHSSYREVFVVDASTPQGHRANYRFPDDVSDDELSTNAPADETAEANTA